MNINNACHPLRDLRFIRVCGPDAAAFLQAQLTIDVPGLPGTGARLAPWLNAKGRVTALFRMAQLGAEDWLLATDRSLAETLVKKLKLYVLRAAVQISPADDDWNGLVIADSRHGLVSARFTITEDSDSWATSDGLLARQTIPGLIEIWGPADELAELQAQLVEDPVALQLWQRGWLAAGLPWLTSEQQDRYTGHMLNLDLLGALSFTKGCYPGQEVVARTENLGRPKRRALLFSCAAVVPETGTVVVDSEGNRQGEIFSAAAASPNLALAVVNLAAAAQPLFLGSHDGQPLKAARQPYAIPELEGSALGAHMRE